MSQRVAVSARILGVLAQSIDSLNRLGAGDYLARPRGTARFDGTITVPTTNNEGDVVFSVHYGDDEHFVELVLP